jgi:hypothetical protein
MYVADVGHVVNVYLFSSLPFLGRSWSPLFGTPHLIRFFD